MNTWLYAMTGVAIVSLISLIGIVGIILKKNVLKSVIFFLVSFAVGALFGDSFIHLIPESFKEFGFGTEVPTYILTGILIFFVLEKFIRWRHCHAQPCEDHPHPIAIVNLVGDAAHNLIDGMLIGASFGVSLPIGIATTIAIVLHEIPHELGNFGVLVHGGFSPKKALLLNFLSALVAILGTVISLAIGSHIEGYAKTLLPITAGGFIYIAGSDLIPELHHEIALKKSALQLICICLGIAIMLLLSTVG